MKCKRIMSLFISAVLVVSLMSGCSKDNPTDKSGSTTTEKTQTSENSGKQEETDKTTEETAKFVETPMDLKGRAIKLITFWAYQWQMNEVEENTSNEIKEVVEAMRSIEKDYNCKIEVVSKSFDTYMEELAAAKAAGDIYGDIIDVGPVTNNIMALIKNGYVMPIENIKSLGVNKFPWEKTTNFGKYKEHNYSVGYMFKNSNDILRNIMVFNKDYAEQFGIGDLYQMVRDGKWTFDKYREVSEIVKEKSGGKVIPTISGRGQDWYGASMVIANGGSFFTPNKEGILEYTGNSDKVREALQFIANYTKDGLFSTEVEGSDKFREGQSMFLFTQYWSVRDHLSGGMVNYDYGIIPPPKGPGETNYTSTLNDGRMFFLFGNIQNPEEVGAVITAMANRAYNNDWKDKELQYALRDVESAEMIELMMKNNVLEYRTVVPDSSAIIEMMTNVAKGTETPQEGLDKIDAQMKAAVEQYYSTEE